MYFSDARDTFLKVIDEAMPRQGSGLRSEMVPPNERIWADELKTLKMGDYLSGLANSCVG